jgi:hypothetical protein
MTALPFRWNGEAMEVVRGFQKRADAAFVVGEVYRLEPVEDRSAASHRHYFAAVNEAWANLPEDQASRFPTPEHLRKWALIQAGYFDRREITCASKAEALRVAAFVTPMDPYAVVAVSGAAVAVLTARSQSVRAMGKAEFQRSKDAVLAVLADMLGVTTDALSRAEAA